MLKTRRKKLKILLRNKFDFFLIKIQHILFK